MKKTRLFSIVLTVVMVASAIFVLVACNKGNTDGGDDTILKEVVAAGQKMDTEQLLAEAKKEKGNFVAYGNTSRITTAMENFVKKYGTELGLTYGATGNANAEKKSDSEIYTLLNSEMNSISNAKNASMVLIQDSASLKRYRDNTKMLTNYIPMGMEDKVDANNLVPLAHQFINKLFMYNNVGNDTLKFTNVWQLTETKYNGKIYFKSPVDEQVNMNFLIMLTNDEWSKKLEDAYKSYNNGQAAGDVGAGKTYKNYGYKWIAEFINNCNFSVNSDTTIASTLSKESNAGKMGLFVLSKLRDASVHGENLNVSAWDKNGDNYQKIDPFAGFMYSIYAQLVTNGPRPYTAMLFINYLMTEEGFKPWGGSLGGYSANKDVPVFDGSLTAPVELTAEQAALGGNDGKSNDGFVYKNGDDLLKYVKKEDVTISGKKVTIKTYMYLEGDNAGTTITDVSPETGAATPNFKASIKTITLEGGVKDSDLSFWTQNLVVEDGNYIIKVRGEMYDWITSLLPANEK